MINYSFVPSTYKKEDCIFLLKDLTDVMEEISVEEKEKRIASGVNYSEMISKEDFVSPEINKLFLNMLDDGAEKLADYIGIISDEAFRQKGNDLIIVSLARAGSPIGVLIKRYLKFKYMITVPHYSISIIRGKGIDENALHYILNKHPKGGLLFVDGWTGKGSITSELKKSIKEFNKKYEKNINDTLAVLADPAKKSRIYGTREDVCIPNACLNSTVSGLVSRTIHNPEYIQGKDFHGAKFFEGLKDEDFTNLFIEKIEECFQKNHTVVSFEKPEESYVEDVINYLIAEKVIPCGFDLTKLKLSIGETSRAIIRRKPAGIYVKNMDNPDLRFVLHMARLKQIPVYERNLPGYACISVLA